MKSRTYSSPKWLLKQCEADLSPEALMKEATFRMSQNPFERLQSAVEDAKRYAADHAKVMVWC